MNDILRRYCVFKDREKYSPTEWIQIPALDHVIGLQGQKCKCYTPKGQRFIEQKFY